ncbi:endonuclease/exonuclease/phosphatase family protein [Rhizoctonia solani AG-3 Rhs1AP]|uniref:Endonuclease/exonuclease/phosphatase family protein n=1 Tax=Rhizoctonia solani AG-3 Rhs1AP TaxID=1086054 RepID=X8JG03_9AGAM|nr:endonuclease/exonuclease/phosphatase family protein [Rhizoctonia solani AG-3 Rhs1AP]
MSIRVDGFPVIYDPSYPSEEVQIKNAMYIGTKIAVNNYGIVNMQGDSSYHNTIYQNDNHTFRTEPPGDSSLSFGLNTLSKYSWVDLSRIGWYPCGEECKTHLGFTFMRVRIDEGVYIDMINLDIDRSTEIDNQMAKRWAIYQVSEFIRTQSEGNAVIVFGNTASLYSRFGDNIQLLTIQNGLKDAWVESIGGTAPAIGMSMMCPKVAQPNITCEEEQKILYRGSPFINLTSSGFYYDTWRFLSPKGDVLSSQNPVRAEFKWELAPWLRQSDLLGGPHGAWFNDICQIPPAPKVAYIILRGASRLDGLTVSLVSGEEFTHGGSGGVKYTLDLVSDEYILSVKLCWGKKNKHTRIFYAKATTNKERFIEVGRYTEYCGTVVAPTGYAVVGTYGQDGKEIDQLGFIYAKQ